MQRVQALFAIHGAKGRCQGLGQYLTAKDMFRIVVLTAEEVFLDGLHIQKIDDFLQDLIHKTAPASDYVVGHQHKPFAEIMGA